MEICDKNISISLNDKTEYSRPQMNFFYSITILKIGDTMNL